MNCTGIRQRFIEYYQQLGFQFLPRAPMLHSSIPMSFVMSAGLVQVETSLANAQNRTGNKFVLVQDCFRHFDLDAVGTDNIHLGLFEMPGTFMFGTVLFLEKRWGLPSLLNEMLLREKRLTFSVSKDICQKI